MMTMKRPSLIWIANISLILILAPSHDSLRKIDRQRFNHKVVIF